MGDATGDIWAGIHQRVARAPLWARGTAGLIVVYVAFYFLIDANALRYAYILTPEHNYSVADAAAILDGRLDLPFRGHDTALFAGAVARVDAGRSPPFAGKQVRRRLAVGS